MRQIAYPGPLPQLLSPTLEECKRMLRSTVELLGASASSVFVLESADLLRGIPGMWDWIRASFGVRLEFWPNVARAVTLGRTLRLTKSEAQGLERDWFEPGGISTTICAPAGYAKASGVVFVDFTGGHCPSPADVAMVELVAATWGSWIGEGRDAP